MLSTDARLCCSFDDVMGAISSNNPRWGITDVSLEFARGAAGDATAAAAPAAPAPVVTAPAPAAATNTLVEAELLAVDGRVTKVVLSGEASSTLRDVLRANNVGVYDAWGAVWNCNGGGQCGLCGVDVLAGGEALSERTPAEDKHLTRKGKPASWRLSCQTCVRVGATGMLRVQAQPQARK